MTRDHRPRNLVSAVRSLDWGATPSVATKAGLRWTTGSLYLIGGVQLMIGARAGLGGDEVEARGVLVIGMVSVVVGAAVVTIGHRLPRWSYHVFGICGTFLIGGLVLLGGGEAASVALSVPFVFVIVNAVFLFAVWQAVLHVATAEIVAASCLIGVGVAPGAILIVLGSTLGLTGVVGWLARVASAADVDSLTGLINRRGFDRRMEETLQLAERDGRRVALAVLDLDGFKKINDVSGHQVGDRLLAECGPAWRGCVPETAVLARYGGDEFALLLPDATLGGAADLADELREHAPDGVTLSVGVAVWTPGDSGSVLMNRADVALYEAKTSGRDMTVAYGDPHRLASELECAIADGQMRLAYQPIVQLATGEVGGYEALARWQHPQRGLVMPDQFVAQAERTGAIRSLGAWAVATVCRDMMTGTGPRRRVGVNASAVELGSPDYASMVLAQLDAWSMPGELLVIEVTEGALDGEKPQVLETLCALRDRGVQIAIDDFGAGYSSLGRLEQLPIDVIKLDGSLVSAIREDSDEAPILEAIVSIARSLGVRLVAERIETAHQASVLRRLGYDLGQGYLFGRPLIGALE